MIADIIRKCYQHLHYCGAYHALIIRRYKMAKDSASGNRLIANNKKAYYDYFIEDTYEAGMRKAIYFSKTRCVLKSFFFTEVR